jgi:hypothetical protein
VVALVYVVLALLLTVGDNDKYGKVAVPGEGRVTLPAESVVIHYEAQANLSENDSIDVPDDLRVRLNPPLELEDGSHISSYQLGSTAGTSVWRTEVPESGDYGVVTSVGPGAPYPNKAVTFGPDAEMGKVLLRGAAIIVIGLLIGGALALWSRRYRRPPATLPPRA